MNHNIPPHSKNNKYSFCFRHKNVFTKKGNVGFIMSFAFVRDHFVLFFLFENAVLLLFYFVFGFYFLNKVAICSVKVNNGFKISCFCRIKFHKMKREVLLLKKMKKCSIRKEFAAFQFRKKGGS